MGDQSCGSEFDASNATVEECAGEYDICTYTHGKYPPSTKMF